MPNAESSLKMETARWHIRNNFPPEGAEFDLEVKQAILDLADSFRWENLDA